MTFDLPETRSVLDYLKNLEIKGLCLVGEGRHSL